MGARDHQRRDDELGLARPGRLFGDFRGARREETDQEPELPPGPLPAYPVPLILFTHGVLLRRGLDGLRERR